MALNNINNSGTTGTGLDSLVKIIEEDRGLTHRVAEEEITEGAQSADAMNQIIIEAIRATGLANDGDLNAADLRDLNSYIRANHLEEWTRLHGDDEYDEETGFHLVQNDGASSRLYATNAVNSVADGLYHMGFEIDGCRFQNEDGNANVSVDTATYWLGDLLKDDLASGSLANDQVDPYAVSQSGTGLDRLVEIITGDDGLSQKIATSEIMAGANSAAEMNAIIIDAIKATGVANNGAINSADMRDLNAWIQANHAEDWVRLHGDDEGDEESGFHLVQNDGGRSELFGGYNAVNSVADGIYHIGFDIEGYRFLNEDGNGNVSVEKAAHWLSQLLEADLADSTLVNSSFNPYVEGSTGTGLDQLVEIISDDTGLNYRISTSDIREGAGSADAMNQIIVDSIAETGVGNDGTISALDVGDMNAWIRANHQDEWAGLHGDDGKDEESGFHLVQNDGASSHLFGSYNAVNTVADGIYHLGFEIDRGRL